MPQLRQLAIAAADPGKLAGFYQEVFDLERLGEERGAVFLSDGSFNIALLSNGRSGCHRVRSHRFRHGAGRIYPQEACSCRGSEVGDCRKPFARRHRP